MHLRDDGRRKQRRALPGRGAPPLAGMVAVGGVVFGADCASTSIVPPVQVAG